MGADSDVVTVVCLKWGDKYPAEYVNRLYRMVNKHLSREFNFVCITENAEGLYPEITIASLEQEEGLTGWWYKLQLFKKNAYGLSGKILFMDLDTVIVSSMDALFEFAANDFTIIKDLQKGKVYNSSLFCFTANTQQQIWHSFLADKDNIMQRMHGDQDWISETVKEAKLWPSQWVVSYKKQCNARAKRSWGKVGKGLRSLGLLQTKGEAEYPEGAKLVYFHGKPDPDDVAFSSYDMWKKSPWIEKAWAE